jgi:hypothetical protein
LYDRKNILVKRNSIIDRATRDYVKAYMGDLRTEVEKLGFNPDNFRSNPMELARRLSSDSKIEI